MIIFMGVAGAGKSIQGKLLAEKLNCSWVSTGELLRRDDARQAFRG
jgi:adenylate kinase family enzyme